MVRGPEIYPRSALKKEPLVLGETRADRLGGLLRITLHSTMVARRCRPDKVKRRFECVPQVLRQTELLRGHCLKLLHPKAKID